MKKRISIATIVAIVLSLLVYGCTASGSVGTNSHQSSQSSSSSR
jgi:hypothetical protein